MVYPMDTAWLDGKIPVDHYRHTRPAYFRQLERAGLITTPEKDADESPSPEPVPGDD
jgi:hypothetical protein